MTDPVDLVYAWCDDTDEKWRAKRMAVAERHGVATSSAENDVCRYRGGDMLRYSIRSVKSYAPWIRRIFVVVDDDQTLPGWPELASEKVVVVRHGEIIPAAYLPTFCADVIEHHVFRIPDLAEHFLYGNDDTFFWESVTPSFFFAEDGYPIMRFGAMRKPAANDVERTYRGGQAVSDSLLMRRFGLSRGRHSSIGRLSHHNIDAYRKSDCLACWDAFRGDIEPFLAYPFRNEKIPHRVLYTGYAMATGHGHFRRAMFNTNYASAWWRRLLPSWAETFQVVSGRWRQGPECIATFHPKLVCFNDGPDTTDEDFVWLRGFLEEKFPALHA